MRWTLMATATVLMTGMEAPAVCSIRWGPVRQETSPHLVVRGTGQFMFTSAVDSTIFGRHRMTLTGPFPAFVVEAYPHGTFAPGESTTTRIAVVPWGYGADCTPESWPDTSWLASGDVTFITPVQVRPESLWVGELPTYDLPWVWVNAIPSRGKPRPENALTAWEYAEIYEHLPTEAEWRSGPAAAAERLLAWARSRGLDQRPGAETWFSRLGRYRPRQ